MNPRTLYERYRELLIHDGFIRYGAQSQETGDEIFIDAYKIVRLHGRYPRVFQAILSQFNVPKVERLITAWERFTEDKPGRKHRITKDKQDIYDILEELMVKEGLFCAKTIEG